MFFDLDSKPQSQAQDYKNGSGDGKGAGEVGVGVDPVCEATPGAGESARGLVGGGGGDALPDVVDRAGGLEVLAEGGLQRGVGLGRLVGLLVHGFAMASPGVRTGPRAVGGLHSRGP